MDSNGIVASVCVPTYNRADLLPRAIRSAQAQTERRIEIFVSDNASTDATEDTVRHMAAEDGRIRFARNPENLGMVRNWNRCVAEARAPLMIVLNDDDELDPNAIDAAAALLGRHPEAVIAFGVTRNCRESGELAFLNRPFGVEKVLWPVETHRAVWLRNCFQASLAVFRTEAARRIGGFAEEVGWCADTDFILRLTARAAAVVTPALMGTYYMHPRQLTGQDNEGVSRWQRRMVERVFDETKGLPELAQLRALAEGEFLSRYAIHYAAAALRRGQREQAVEFLRQARSLGIPGKLKHRALYAIVRTASALPGGTAAFQGFIAPGIKRLAANMSRMD